MSVVAIMQPYFFPYLGYFELVACCDKFVFYDDVNYIKRGWINRNRINVSGEPKYFTIPINSVSQNRMIKESYMDLSNGAVEKVLNSIRYNYRNSPCFSETYEFLESVMQFAEEKSTISEFAALSVTRTAEYLGLNTQFLFSSKSFADTKGLERSDRLIEITKKLGGTQYVNMASGKVLYDTEYFKSKGVDLSFLEATFNTYPQSTDDFLPGLSIIDVLMNVPSARVSEFLSNGQKLV